jgi:hypothetical protein
MFDNGFMKTRYLVTVLAVFFVEGARADICKWVDDDGVTHYAMECPESVDASEVDIEEGPSAEQVDAAIQRSEALRQSRETDDSPLPESQAFHSMPLESLGAAPEYTTSVYLRSIHAGIGYYTHAETGMQDVSGEFHLELKARENLPRGSLLEVDFPRPERPDSKSTQTRKVIHNRQEFRFVSPRSSAFKCWNYEVEVKVWKDRNRTELLGTHRQLIQSRNDLALVTDALDFLRTGSSIGGKCPSAHESEMESMSPDQLANLCEQARQARLAPEREQLIENCIRQERKDAEACRRFYADWGAAVRTGRDSYRPPLYYDLPECLAAKEAGAKFPR